MDLRGWLGCVWYFLFSVRWDFLGDLVDMGRGGVI